MATPTFSEVLISGNKANGTDVYMGDGAGNSPGVLHLEGGYLDFGDDVSAIPMTLASNHTSGLLGSTNIIDIDLHATQVTMKGVTLGVNGLNFADFSNQQTAYPGLIGTAAGNIDMNFHNIYMGDGSTNPGGNFNLEGLLMSFGTLDGSTPSNTVTPSMWAKVEANGGSAWIPLYQ